MFVKEKTEKKKASIKTAVGGPQHQIAGGIKDGAVRRFCVYAERFG